MSQLVQNKQWKHTAIQRSEVITDTWDVAKVYLGRGAVVILFICMIGDVIQVLPGGLLAQWIIATILGVQIVTIDVAGFGLQSIAEAARLNGDEKGYRKAINTSYALIAIMMITLFLLTIGQIWPNTKGIVSIANDVLILVRVGMTVLYGHIVHSLGKSQSHSVPSHIVEDLQRQIERLRQDHEATVRRLETETRDKVTFLETQQQQKIDAAIQEVESRLSLSVSTPVSPVSVDVLETKDTDDTPKETTHPYIQRQPNHNEPVSQTYKPVEAVSNFVSDTDRDRVIQASKEVKTKREICPHLGWSTSRYPVVKRVLDEYQRQKDMD